MLDHVLGGIRRFALGLAVASALVSTIPGAPASAATPDDLDGDGVANAVDACPGTPFGDLVDAQGCSVCPCTAAWPSHEAYVACVTTEATRRLGLGLMTRKQRSVAIRAAQNSTCGTAKTRCCTWRKLVPGALGTCKVLDPALCNYDTLGKWAEDRGPGTCYYNPCPWF
jgi:hypothetical protein